MRPILAICLGLLCAAPAFAQEAWQVERTPDGKPDLHGVWATRFITRLERAPGATSLEVSPEEAGEIAAAIATRISSTAVNDPDFAFYGFDQLASVNGKFRTALIVDPEDGKIPFTPAGAERDERFSTLESYGFDHPEERPGYERCLSGILAAPIRVLPMLIPMRIVQTPEAVVLTNEDVQGLRIIPLGGPQSPSAIRPLDGVGRGRWDGDTLVVDTSNFRADDIARPDMGPPSC